MALAQGDAAQVLPCHDRRDHHRLLVAQRVGDQGVDDELREAATVRNTPALVIRGDCDDVEPYGIRAAQRCSAGGDQQQLGMEPRYSDQPLFLKEHEQAVAAYTGERKSECTPPDEALDLVRM